MHCCYSKHHTAEPEDRLPVSTMYFKQGLPALDQASRHHGAAGHAYCIWDLPNAAVSHCNHQNPQKDLISLGVDHLLHQA